MEDGRTRYNKVTKLLEPIVGKTIPLGKIKRRVMIDIGSSEGVIRETIQLMIDLGLIVERSNLNYEIISNKADL